VRKKRYEEIDVGQRNEIFQGPSSGFGCGANRFCMAHVGRRIWEVRSRGRGWNINDDYDVVIIVTIIMKL
jgi:hypothetical protein